MQKIFIIILFSIFSLTSHAQTVITLKGKVFSLKGNGPIWIEDGQVVKAKEKQSRVEFVGIKNGQSTVKWGTNTYNVQVLELSHFKAHSELGPIVKNILGLSLRAAEGRLVVSGQILDFADWMSLKQICEIKDCGYWLKAGIKNEFIEMAREKIKLELKSQGLPIPQIYWQMGLRASLAIKHPHFIATKKALERWGIYLEADPDGLDAAPTIKVQIHLAEVKKDFFRQYGIQWQNSYKAQLLPNFVGGSYEATLSAIENQGKAKILASPNLLCRSGKEAEFLAGGEFPIRIMNEHFKDVVWKKYGVLLKIKPKADMGGSMSLSIETEVSTIDDSRKVDGIPGLFTNRVQSFFDLRETKTILLSGLIKQEMGQSSQGLPGLVSIPILGALFGSQDFRQNKSELVILVRPEIVDLSE
jgi:pilus assembly protein CpaC